MPIRSGRWQWPFASGRRAAARDSLARLRRPPGGAFLRVGVAVLAVGWIASSLLAGLTPLDAPVSAEANRPTTTAGSAAVAPAMREPIDIDTVASWNLFGDAGATGRSTESRLDEIEAASADTALDITLQGVIAANAAAEASIVVQVNGAQRRYRVGETLPVGNQVSVAKVLPDRAVLRNGNRFETLRLYAALSRPEERRATDIADDTQASSVTASSVTEEPGSVIVLADVIDITEQLSGDRVVGYRAAPGRHAALFDRLGLQPGDVITAVNGIDFSTSGATLEHYNPLQLSSDATLVIRRGTETLTLFVATDS